MKKILLFGAQGLLGSDLYATLSETDDFQVTPFSHFNGDISSRDHLQQVFQEFDPDIVLNAVGFTDVDAAESRKNRKLLTLLNVTIPGLLAKMSTLYGAKYIHFSTDYVFDGKTGGYDELSPVRPINAYGESKMEGEMEIWDHSDDATIIRTSRLYGRGRENFVTRVAQLAKKGKPIPAIADEWGNFTSTVSLAQSVRDILLQSAEDSGVLHLFGEGSYTPAEIAHKIVALFGSSSVVTEIQGETLERPAKRPQNTSLKTIRSDGPLAGVDAVFPEFFQKHIPSEK